MQQSALMDTGRRLCIINLLAGVNVMTVASITSSQVRHLRPVHIPHASRVRYLWLRSGQTSAGLLCIPALSSPSAFERTSQSVLQSCKSFRNNILSNQDDGKVQRNAVKLLDLLSDSLCSVVDKAELLRTVHPSEAFVKAAEKVSNEGIQYMNQLNVDVELYKVR